MKSTIQAFLQESAPCDNCPMATGCKEKKTACVDFWQYIEQPNKLPKSVAAKSRRSPTRELYNFIYCGEDSAPKGLLKIAVRSLPNRAQNVRVAA